MIFKLNSEIKIYGLDTDFYRKNNKKFEYKFIKKDIRDISREDLEGMETVIHLASLSNDPLGSLNTKLTEQINYEATIKLAKYAKRQKVKIHFYINAKCLRNIEKQQ